MRIAYFHQYFSTPDGAAGTRSYEMSRRLIARGHQVLMICGSAERGQTGLSSPFVGGRRRGTIACGIEVLEFDLGYSNRDGILKRSLAFLVFALRSVNVALTEEYDLIFATSTPLTAGIPGIFARWLRRKRFVFEVRDLWPELPRAMGYIRSPVALWALSCLELATYRSAHAFVGLSPGIVDGIASRGVDRDRITLVPNGCDLELFSGPVNRWRPDGVAENDLMAIFTGAHGIANGLDAVLDSAAELKRRGRDDIKIVLVGAGKLKADLQQRVAADGLSNVIFHPPVDKARLAGLMDSADIGLQILANVPAFYYGTSPNKFFDYLSAGLAVLINYPGWLAEVVATHECGYVVPPADPRAFADALMHAADNRSELTIKCRRAMDVARGRFDRRILSTQFAEWLEQAAS